MGASAASWRDSRARHQRQNNLGVSSRYIFHLNAGAAHAFCMFGVAVVTRPHRIRRASWPRIGITRRHFTSHAPMPQQTLFAIACHHKPSLIFDSRSPPRAKNDAARGTRRLIIFTSLAHRSIIALITHNAHRLIIILAVRLIWHAQSFALVSCAAAGNIFIILSCLYSLTAPHILSSLIIAQI